MSVPENDWIYEAMEKAVEEGKLTQEELKKMTFEDMCRYLKLPE